MESFKKAKLQAVGLKTTDRPEREKTTLQAQQVEEQFFADYIDSWIDEFLDAVEKADPHPFYKILTEQTRMFVT